MADTLARFSPLQPWADRFAAMPEAARVTEEPFVTMVDLWVDPAAVPAVLGIDLPTTPSTSIEGVIWLGPQEWLVTSTTGSGVDLEGQLQAVVADHDGAATDVSAQRTSLRLTGSHARHVLAKGCSLDLHPSVFRPGAAAQTMLALAAVVLIPLDDNGTDYRILVRSSFAGYLADWLLDAAEEFGVDW